MFWIGIVENRFDPMKLGRVQVRIFGAHTPDLNDIPTDDLPWAVVLQPTTSAAISGVGTSATGLVEGSMVFGYFQDGESKQNPIVFGSAPGVSMERTSYPTATASTAIEAQSPGYVTSSVRNTTDSNLDTSGNSTGVTTPIDSTDPNVALKAALGKRESNNNYQAENRLGYIGKYQMGAAMLTDLGYVKKGTTNKSLTKPENWTGKDGITGRDAFLNSSSVQEKAMDAELVMNKNRLTKMQIIDSSSTDQEIAGYLATSHLLGTGGARKLKRGDDGSDANGVSGISYYRLGYAAVNGAPPTVLPEATTPDNPARPASPYSETGFVQNAPKTLSMGFTDPNGVYPKYIGEQDTSRLARNQNINKTMVAFKESTMDKGVRTSHGGTAWDQSPIPFNPTYPFNQVYETEAGHIQEFDSTPKNERYHLFHPSGTFVEVDRNGTEVRKIVGDKYEIWERNGHVHIKGTVNITVEGNANILVANDCNLEVDGNFDTRVGGNYNLSVQGDHNVMVGGKESHSVGGDYAVDASNIHLNSGESSAGDLEFATDATGVPSFTPLTVDRRGFESLSDFESDDATDDEIDATRQKLVDAGVIDDETTPAAISEPEKVETVEKEPEVVSCDMFVSGKINMNEHISANYRLKDLTLGRTIKSQGGKTDAEIACNLKHVAVNILEPIKAMYPSMIVTSGYREFLDNPRSMHPLGQATDMQFKVPASEYLEIAKKLASTLVFDQLILEYQSDIRVNGEPKVWIHVAYSTSGNRQQVFTMNNHKRISKFGELRAVS